MKIALLARNPHLYSHRRIVEAARARGHDIEIINTIRASINITSRKPALYYRKRALDNFDAVIPRIGASVTFYGLAVLPPFEVMGVYPLNESVAIGCSRGGVSDFQLRPSPTIRARPRTSSISSAARQSSSSCSRKRKASGWCLA